MYSVIQSVIYLPISIFLARKHCEIVVSSKNILDSFFFLHEVTIIMKWARTRLQSEWSLYVHKHIFENIFFPGLLPETYSDPDFPGMDVGRVEFEGGQKPSDFGNRFNQDSSKSGSKNTGNDMRRLGQNIPNLEPDARAGSCQPYVGSVCSKYVGQEYVFITEGLTLQYIEQKLNAALTVITASPGNSWTFLYTFC